MKRLIRILALLLLVAAAVVLVYRLVTGRRIV